MYNDNSDSQDDVKTIIVTMEMEKDWDIDDDIENSDSNSNTVTTVYLLDSDFDEKPSPEPNKKKRKKISEDVANQGNSSDVRQSNLPPSIDGQFFIYEGTNYDKDKVGIVKVKCINCDCTVSTYMNTTTNLHRHMKRKHQALVDDFRNYCASRRRTSMRNKTENLMSSVPSMPPMSSHTETITSGKNLNLENKLSKVERLERSVLRYIVKDMRPLSTIESENFRSMFMDIDPELVLRSRRTAGRRLNREFHLVKQKLITLFDGLEYVCTTADIWNTKHRSFLSITIHWIDVASLERKNAVLACRRFKGPQTCDQIMVMLANIFDEFRIPVKKNVGTITDNVGNFKEIFNEFGLQSSSFVPQEILSTKEEDNLYEKLNNYMDDNFAENKMLPVYFQCMAHTLSLFASADFIQCLKENISSKKLHDSVMKKCNIIWADASRLKIIEEYKEITGCDIITPVITRWISVYNAIASLYVNKKHLDDILKVRMPENPVQFTRSDLEYMQEFLEIMKPIATGLEILESKSYYGHVLPVIFTIRDTFELMMSKSFKYFRTLLPKLKELFENRFGDLLALNPKFKDAVLAACFHPEIKTTWVPEDKAQYVMNLCKRAVQQLHDIESDDSSTATKICTEDDKNKTKLEIELAAYFNRAYNNTKSGLVPFFSHFPNIKKLFIKHNTILSSSAPVERLLSHGSLILAPNRSLLSDSNFEEIIFLKGNEDYSVLLQ